LYVVEFSGQAHGVLREAWYGVFELKRATMSKQSVFKTPPDSEIILRNFDAPVDVAERYVQRLTSYLQVSSPFVYDITSEAKSLNAEWLRRGHFLQSRGYDYLMLIG